MGITLAHLKEAVDRLLDRIALVAQTASKSIEEMEKTKADKVNIMSLTIPTCAKTALTAGLTSTESFAGKLRLRAQQTPTAAITAVYYIVK